MYIGVCEYCGKKKQYKYKSQIKRFCSHKCSNNYKWKNIRNRAKYLKIVCPTCNRKFDIYENDYRIKQGKKLYCSKECANIGSMTGKNIKCKYCSKEFYSTRNEFCSQQCAILYRKKIMNTNCTKKMDIFVDSLIVTIKKETLKNTDILWNSS